MSDGCIHIHDGEDNHMGWICRGTGTRYSAWVRYEGYRKYERVGKWTKSRRVAMRRLADAMETGDYKRGMVVFAQDWYDPEPIYEMVAR